MNGLNLFFNGVKMVIPVVDINQVDIIIGVKDIMIIDKQSGLTTLYEKVSGKTMETRIIKTKSKIQNDNEVLSKVRDVIITQGALKRADIIHTLVQLGVKNHNIQQELLQKLKTEFLDVVIKKCKNKEFYTYDKPIEVDINNITDDSFPPVNNA